MYQLAPLPRFRLYTSRSVYGRLAGEMVTGRFHHGDQDIGRFERAVAKFIGGRETPSFHAVAMPMARVAIYHAIKAIVRPGDAVVMSPYTIADVVNMVIAAGARPVFADVDAQSGNLRPDEVARLIDHDTGAVLATHFFGCAAAIVEIAKICREYNIPLIEDAAQAFGCAVNGRRVGTFGNVGIFSFGMYKNVNAFYGGLALTRDKALAERLRAGLDDYAVEPLGTYLPKFVKGLITDVLTFPLVFKLFSFWFFRWTFLKDVETINNTLRIDVDPKRFDTIPADYLHRMSPAQARVLLPQLPAVDVDNWERIRKAGLYFEGLKDIAEIVLPPFKQDGSHIYNYVCIQVPDRRALVRFMMQHRADISEGHHRNCADLPCFEAFARECPVARQVAASLVFLPNYPRYADAEIRRNVSLIREFFGCTAITPASETDEPRREAT
jgi:dTDP-4-amino-4,6-dideoxygalactose transaminase